MRGTSLLPRPAAPETVAAHLANLAETVSTSTLKVRRAAVGAAHRAGDGRPDGERAREAGLGRAGAGEDRAGAYPNGISTISQKSCSDRILMLAPFLIRSSASRCFLLLSYPRR